MPARKRTIEEVEAAEPPAPTVPPMLQKLRNMWELASLMQYIYFFGECLKISPDVDIEMLEMECCKPTPSDLLSQIGLALLKHVSSHRGLTPDIFDEYARRQFVAKAPTRNPFGEDEEPRPFRDFDVYTKIRVLQQISTWTLNNPTRIREYYGQSVPDQTIWRIEEFGWDKQDRTYYVLDDNRMYRLTQPKPPSVATPKPKAKRQSKPMPKKAKGSRSSKRQKLLAIGDGEESDVEEVEQQEEDTMVPEEESEDNGLGGAKWECVAVSSNDYIGFMENIRKSKDANEKALVKRMQEEIMPEIERQAAARERKEAAQRKELMNLERLATAKRSSRLAGKQEQMKQQQEAEEAERKQREELAMARREQEKQQRLEEARESRMMTREQRLREREVKRILHEEDLNRLEAMEQDTDSAEGRSSERQRKTEMEKKKEELAKWTESEGEWYFDCAICGVHGKNLDDGTHSIACDECDTWQHSACHGIKETDAEKSDFSFLCASCAQPRQIKVRMASSKSPVDSKKKRKSTADAKQPNGGPPSKEQALQSPNGIEQSRPHAAMPPPQAHWTTSSNQSSSPAPSVPTPNQHVSYPSQGHFPPYQHHGPSGYMHPNAHPQYYRAPGAHQAPPTPITNGVYNQSPYPNARPPYASPQGASYNPYQNGFERSRPSSAQRPGSSGQSFAHATPQSRNQQSDNQYGTQGPPLQARTPMQPYGAATLHANGPNIAASPTPSLSATQGQTDMRFSPSKQYPMAPNNAYIPNTNRPSPAAYSPMKHTPPPASATQQYESHGNQDQNGAPVSPGAVTGAQAPILHSTSPSSRTAGVSPVKHDLPPSSPIAPSAAAPRQVTPPPLRNGFGLDGMIESPTKPKHADHSSLVSNMPAITSPPSLQPNVGIANGSDEASHPPVKHDLPTTTMSPSLAQSQ